MVSVYGFITIAGLQNYTGLDYSTIDATAFSDTNVDLKITTAERMVNGYYGSTQTSSDKVISCTLQLAAHLLSLNLTFLGYGTPEIEAFLINPIKTLNFWLKEDRSIGVDAIPMSGANN